MKVLSVYELDAQLSQIESRTRKDEENDYLSWFLFVLQTDIGSWRSPIRENIHN
jgi:hypothetical protein